MELTRMGLTLLIFVLCLSTVVDGCKVANWVKRSMEWRLYRSEIVVYGKDIGRIQGWDEEFKVNKTDMLFRVYCVLKGNASQISDTITVDNVVPRFSCLGMDMGPGKGPDVHPNETAMVALKRLKNGNYFYDLVNPSQRVAFEPTDDTFRKAYEVCGLQKPMLPWDRMLNATYPGCPNVTIPPGPCTTGETNGSLETSNPDVLLSLLIAFIFKLMTG